MRETFETTLADGRSIYKPMVPRCWFYRMIASEAFKAGDRVRVTVELLKRKDGAK